VTNSRLTILYRLRQSDCLSRYPNKQSRNIWTVVIPLPYTDGDGCLTPCAFFKWYGGGDWVQLGPLCTAATNRPIVRARGDYDDGEIGGMIGRGNRSTRRKPAPMPLCPTQTPHGARTASVGRQRLTSWAWARPSPVLSGFSGRNLPIYKVNTDTIV
jgi:hypothetical protein